MNTIAENKWDPSFIKRSPVFDIFNLLSLEFSEDWPTIGIYNEILKQSKKIILSGGEKSIQFVTQFEKSQDFEKQYEPGIFLKGEVQTREKNWHDFFNMLVWLTFPKAKSALNKIQYSAMKLRTQDANKKRLSIENFATLLDENGMIVVSEDASLLNLIKTFQWKILFWEKREEVILKMKFLTIGHSLYEKMMDPYIGLTGHAILMEVENSFFKCHLKEQLDIVDDYLSKTLNGFDVNQSPKLLCPLPILGIPHFYNNQDETFYENADYFRKKRAECQPSLL